MASKPRNRASLDADAVARMMREQEEPDAPPAEIPLAPVSPEPAPAMAPPTQSGPAVLGLRDDPTFDPGKTDGRTLRRTGREPFATRIKPEAQEKVKRIAYRRGITMAEALEIVIAAYSDD